MTSQIRNIDSTRDMQIYDATWDLIMARVTTKRLIKRLQFVVESVEQGVVTAEQIAEVIDVSPRTVYRYIRSLRGAGVNIQGEAGVGFAMVTDRRK